MDATRSVIIDEATNYFEEIECNFTTKSQDFTHVVRSTFWNNWHRDGISTSSFMSNFKFWFNWMGVEGLSIYKISRRVVMTFCCLFD